MEPSIEIRRGPVLNVLQGTVRVMWWESLLVLRMGYNLFLRRKACPSFTLCLGLHVNFGTTVSSRVTVVIFLMLFLVAVVNFICGVRGRRIVLLCRLIVKTRECPWFEVKQTA